MRLDAPTKVRRAPRSIMAAAGLLDRRQLGWRDATCPSQRTPTPAAGTVPMAPIVGPTWVVIVVCWDTIATTPRSGAVAVLPQPS